MTTVWLANLCYDLGFEDRIHSISNEFVCDTPAHNLFFLVFSFRSTRVNTTQLRLTLSTGQLFLRIMKPLTVSRWAMRGNNF